MKRKVLIGALISGFAILTAGCASKIEIGPVPSVTPRAEETVKPKLTPTPTPVEKAPSTDEVIVVKKNYKEQYETTGQLPSLYEVYKDRILLGADVLKSELEDTKKQQIITSQFGFISSDEDFAPEALMDYEATRASGNLEKAVLDFSGADVILKYAKENGKPVHGPVLISQNMPYWFFTKDFLESQVITTEEDGVTTTSVEQLPSQEILLARMENYIIDVMEYCNTNYPGVVVSWDVLNDVIHPTDQMEKKYRNSYWYQVIGEDYIVKAFEIAKEHKTKDQKLFYREDGLTESLSRNPTMDVIAVLKEKGLLDGFSMNLSYTVSSPNVLALDDVMKAVAKTELEVRVLNLSASTNTNSEDDINKTEEENLEKSAKRYKALMSWYEKVISQGTCNITSITFSRVSDESHPENQPKEYIDKETKETVFGVRMWNYGAMFDKDWNPKDAFFGALQDEGIKAY